VKEEVGICVLFQLGTFGIARFSIEAFWSAAVRVLDWLVNKCATIIEGRRKLQRGVLSLRFQLKSVISNQVCILIWLGTTLFVCLFCFWFDFRYLALLAVSETKLKFSLMIVILQKRLCHVNDPST